MTNEGLKYEKTFSFVKLCEDNIVLDIIVAYFKKKNIKCLLSDNHNSQDAVQCRSR